MSQEETSSGTSEGAAEAPARFVTSDHEEDADADSSEARKMIVIQQLTSNFGFYTTDIAERAVGEVGADVSAATKYILESGLAKDTGGTVIPREDCPHVKHHVKVSINDLPAHPKDAVCTFYRDQGGGDDGSTREQTGQLKSDGESTSGNHSIHPACLPDENWLCLECGLVYCGRYISGHGLQHWRDTKEKERRDRQDNNINGPIAGHCIAASLADLSVWCHECESYIHDPLLDPLLQKLEHLKFHDAELEPKRKKARSQPNSEDEALGDSSAPDEEDGTGENGDDDDDDDDNDSDMSPTIIAVANAVARGIPIDLLVADEEEEEIEYPFGDLPTSLEDVATFIQSDNCRSICILAGAGMSVESGIPDFRSADGLYATMNPDLLTANPMEREAIRMDPTVALEQGMFLQNPLPCLELNREFILGTYSQRWKATLAHRFVELLHAKTNKLVRLYTQNIDGLEMQTQLPRDKTIAVHGSMDRAECARCGQESDFAQFCDQVRDQIKDLSGKDASAPRESSAIACKTCGYLSMKPAIVLFRSSLPMAFFENVPRDMEDVDLLIVIGTSLRVAPANSLVWRAPKKALRVLVNREPVGWHLGMTFGPDSNRDYFAQGNCDQVMLDLMTHLGWLEDLEPLLQEQKLPDTSAAMLRQRLDRESALEQQARQQDEALGER